MSGFHCSCGFAVDDADEFGDHLRIVFAPDDDTGTDGQVHAEVTGGYARGTGRFPAGSPLPRHVCRCGFAADDTAEFDDHLLLVFVPPDGIATDGDRHVAVNPAIPHRLLIEGLGDGEDN
jgi:hypothetical protein